jgi:hypothetical protein
MLTAKVIMPLECPTSALVAAASRPLLNLTQLADLLRQLTNKLGLPHTFADLCELLRACEVAEAAAYAMDPGTAEVTHQQFIAALIAAKDTWYTKATRRAGTIPMVNGAPQRSLSRTISTGKSSGTLRPILKPRSPVCR